MFVNQTSCSMSCELKLSSNSRKRVREVKRITEPENDGSNSWGTLSLINRFNELSLFEDNEEQIEDKDTICQDFIDRFEKLYKPAAINEEKALEMWPVVPHNENSENNSVKLKLKYCHDVYASATKDNCPMYIFNDKFGEELERRKLLNDYYFPNNLQKDVVKYELKNRRPPYGWFADIIMRKATIETEPFGARSGRMLMYGVDNFNSDFFASIGWTTKSKQNSVKALMYVDSHNDSDSSNVQMTTSAKKQKRRKFDSSNQ